MKIPFHDLSRKQAKELDDLQRTFRSCLLEDYLSAGKAVHHFERNFADYIGTEYGVACGNGTDALEIIFRALGIGEGDEVIVPANGWLSAAEMAKLLGATPIFADVNPRTYTISPTEVEAAISPRTKAIVPIHLYGHPADMPAIMDMALKHNLYVVEDCAQAHGAAFGEKKAGSWGHAAAFSFYPTKNLGALGDAGAILTQDPTLADTCRRIANHGQHQRDQHVSLGRNSRIDTIQAAVLDYRLQKLDETNRIRKQLARLYYEELQHLPLVLPFAEESVLHVYHLFVVRTRHRNALRDFLQGEGIGTAIHYPQAVSDMEHLHATNTKIASQQAHELLSLPLYPEIREEEILSVCAGIRRFFQQL